MSKEKSQYRNKDFVKQFNLNLPKEEWEMVKEVKRKKNLSNYTETILFCIRETRGAISP